MLGFASVCFGQGQVLFFEDFESGAAGWSYDNSDNGLWHIASDGECLSITKMAAYNNGPAVCNYVTGGVSNVGFLFSPAFVLSGFPPHTVGLEYIRSVDISDGGAVNIYIVETQGVASAEALPDNSGTLQSESVSIPCGIENQLIQVVFSYSANPTDNNHLGFYVDNVEVRNSGNPGDFDGDGDVDQDDYDAFAACFTGAGGCIPAACEYGDLDANGCLDNVYPPATCFNQPPACPLNEIGYWYGDSDIDCADWQAFKAAWTGPPASPPALPQCDTVFGDINGSGGVNLDDILCMLACFGGNCTCAGGIASADIWPCGGNGAVDLDDILNVLSAFAGNDPCP